MSASNTRGPYDYMSPGLGDAGAFQVAGIPYASLSTAASSSVVQVSFPYVTSWVYIVQHSNNDLRVGFSANGVNNNNHFLLPSVTNNGGQVNTPILPFKVSSLFFRSDDVTKSVPFYVCAGLTSIPTTDLANSGPSGANWSGSSGVG